MGATGRNSKPAGGSRWGLLAVRSGLHLLVFAVSTAVWGLLSLFTFPLPYRARYYFVTRWTHFNLWALEVLCGIRCDVRGIENIPERAGIVMAKHQSTWETMALQRWFSPQTWVLKRELLRIPFFGWAIGLLEPVAIDRGSRAGAMRQVVKQGAERLADGRWLVVFPEGTRVEPGQKGRYQIGGAVLAEKLETHIVPVAHNAGRFWNPHRFLRQSGTIQVRIGPPISTKGKPAKVLLRQVEDWIEGQMAEIEGEERDRA